MEYVKRIQDIPLKQVPAPDLRNLQVVYDPQFDEGCKDFTFLVSTLYPINGQTDYHIHPVDEMILICSGYGEVIVEGNATPIQKGSVLYAPAGIRHQCKNFSSETMQMACFYIPALPTAANIVKDSTIAIKK